MNEMRSRLPSVTSLLARADVAAHVDAHGRPRVLDALRTALEAARHGDPGAASAATADEIVAAASARLRKVQQLKCVINATGVVVHTNLGRSTLSETARDAMLTAAGPVDLEFDLEGGRRGGRNTSLGEGLALLCGGEEAHVVNNGAAALVLVATALAHGRDIIVSRGELVEIGGSFRLPEIITAAGARLREVGTTNRTRIADYADALHPDTGAILVVHPSNFRIEGFTERPSLSDLAVLAHDRGVPLVHDIGSGLVVPDAESPLSSEPDASSSIAQGADITIFSGDKLFGGPQAGILVGRARWIAPCRAHPLSRALRLDKIRVAALEATVLAHARGQLQQLPTWQQIHVPTRELHRRAERLAALTGGQCIETASLVGGGAAPTVTLPSWGVRLRGDAENLSRRLRRGTPAVVARIIQGSVVIDVRTVPEERDEALADAVRDAVG